MKLSIIISILNSQEILRRQLLHFNKMDIPDDVEFILIDDGSDPPLDFSTACLKTLTIHRTFDKRAWTVELARNKGAELARGENLLMTDIDYIIPLDAIMSARDFKEDKMRFKRQFGVLDEYGNFTQDLDVLRSYGLLEERISHKGVKLPPHPNNFVMKKEAFYKLGRYREDLVDRPYPNKGDTYFKREWAKAYDAGEVSMIEYRPTLFMFPNGQYCGDVDYNPFNLFHDLTRKTENNHWHLKMKENS